jgi:hypothetical protein
MAGFIITRSAECERLALMPDAPGALELPVFLQPTSPED